MLTQCPKCETVYRVDAAELGAAQGFVECGDCGEQFSALSRLADEPKLHSESTTLPSPVEGTSPPPQTTDRSRHSGPAFVLLDSEEADAAIEHKTSEKLPISAVDLEPVAAAPTSSTIDFAAVAPPAQTLSESEHAILFTDPQLEFEGDED